MVLTDQQRMDTIQSLGATHMDTPHLDRLVEEGVTFTDCHVTAPLCVPSRASLFTGYYPHTTGIYSNADEWRHSTLVELPFAEGDWADAILRSYLYDVAEAIRLAALADSSYARIRDRVGKIRGEEGFHREHAERWMERLTSDDQGRERMQDAVDRLLPHALTLFAPTDEEIEARIDDLGLRTATLDEMREQWLDTVVPYLEDLDLHVGDAELPAEYDASHDDVELPDAIGRDQSHTDAWSELYEDFTRTYDELDRESATRIMADPDDV